MGVYHSEVGGLEAGAALYRMNIDSYGMIGGGRRTAGHHHLFRNKEHHKETNMIKTKNMLFGTVDAPKKK